MRGLVLIILAMLVSAAVSQFNDANCSGAPFKLKDHFLKYHCHQPDCDWHGSTCINTMKPLLDVCRERRECARTLLQSGRYRNINHLNADQLRNMINRDTKECVAMKVFNSLQIVYVPGDRAQNTMSYILKTLENKPYIRDPLIRAISSNAVQTPPINADEHVDFEYFSRLMKICVDALRQEQGFQ